MSEWRCGEGGGSIPAAPTNSDWVLEAFNAGRQRYANGYSNCYPPYHHLEERRELSLFNLGWHFEHALRAEIAEALTTAPSPATQPQSK